MAADHDDTTAACSRSLAARGMGRDSLFDLLRWHRIPGGLRYLRRYGTMALLLRLFPQLGFYRLWVGIYDRLTRKDVAAIHQHIGRLANRPLISVLMPVASSESVFLRRAIKRIAAQLYPEWELCIAGDPAVVGPVAQTTPGGRVKIVDAGPDPSFAAAFNAALAVATGTLVALMRAEDELAPHALYLLAVELGGDPEAAVLYSDEDAIGPGGRRDHRFKTDWNPDLLLGHDAIGRLAAYRRDIVVRIGGLRSGFDGAEEYDLALRASEEVGPDRIRHIPMILYHRRGALWPADANNSPTPADAHCRAVAEHLTRTGIAAAVSPLPGHRVRVHHKLPEPRPQVSLIVPTRDKVDLLRRCVDGLLNETDYEELELIIVDNDSAEPETHAYFAELAAVPRVRVVSYPGLYNYAAINNFGVAQARYDLVGLLNNDIEVIHRDWLREMVSHAVRPEIGVVGAKLYYPDDTIQHAGTILGLGGGANHAFRDFRRAAPGYCDRLLLTQNLSAVTAACMLLRRRVFEEVGGLDAVNLPVAFNDVDLCLRIREKGYRIVWTPFAELYHWESVSRGSDKYEPEKIERFQRERKYLVERWRAVIAHDPYYNPNLTVDELDFGLAFPPRVSPPWRDYRPLV
jgi:GT2 family glycosyltransferase